MGARATGMGGALTQVLRRLPCSEGELGGAPSQVDTMSKATKCHVWKTVGRWASERQDL